MTTHAPALVPPSGSNGSAGISLPPAEELLAESAALRPSILDRMTTLSDAIRCRLLLLLELHELAVSELCTVLQLPQSTASRHLKLLADDGWVLVRREGTSRCYSAPLERLEPAARRLWLLVREQLAGTPAAEQDHQRLEGVLAARRSTSQAFFSSAAGEWDQLRRELFGSRFDFHGLLGLVDEGWVVADLGCGTGQVASYLAPLVGRVIAVDDSEAMLRAARGRLAGTSGVELRQGHLESLPIADAELDAAILSLVLHHQPEPARVVAEAARALRPGGKLLVIDMLPHDREEYRQQMGHVWLGISETQLERWLVAAGLVPLRRCPLPVAAEVRGPALFLATARRSGASQETS